MQVTETLSEGLKREFRVVVPATELDSRLTSKLEEMKATTQIRGFRPGKVPVQHLRRLVGRQTMSQIVQDLLSELANKTLNDRGERAALQPTFDLTEDEEEAERVLSAKADLEYAMKYEVLPQVTLGDFATIRIERPVADVPEEEIANELERLARGSATYVTKDGAAESGDRVTMDYVGKLDGEAFEGGSDTGANLVIGSNQFVPGFEEQLIGAKAGEDRVVTVTFPEDYGAPQLAGREASFDVSVKEVASPESVAIDDALAQKFGLDSVAKLRDAVKTQLQGQLEPFTRQKVKRRLLDQLDTMHAFDLPPTMVEREFEQVWREVLSDMERTGQKFDEENTEEEARTYYRAIAERRVRLGLVLAEIGDRNKIEVTEQELQRALNNEIRRYPGREQQIYNFYRENPSALNALRAPIFEEKVVDYILELADVRDKTVTREELTSFDEDEQGLPGRKSPGEA
jgi:trigger factor